MLFSELYSVYYHTVASILKRALEPNVTEKDLQQEVVQHAFSESVMTILPALKSERWQLLHSNWTPVVRHTPTLPLTHLEKRWLKSLMDDPRLRLFDVSFPALEDVEPLFTRRDYRVYDQYTDGDPYEDETYIQHFRLIREAIRTNRPVCVTFENRHGEMLRTRFYPRGFEYSPKDDKLRVLASNWRYREINLGRIRSCAFYTGNGLWRDRPPVDKKRTLTLEITDERNALERVMLHFAHFEKRAERIPAQSAEGGEQRYRLELTYYESDETELVIRILSFGPYIRVVEPATFVDLIRERLKKQKSCGLK